MKNKQTRATIPAQIKKNGSKEMAAASKTTKKGGSAKMSGKKKC